VSVTVGDGVDVEVAEGVGEDVGVTFGVLVALAVAVAVWLGVAVGRAALLKLTDTAVCPSFEQSPAAVTDTGLLLGAARP
jgi:hypothetical protein